MIEIIACVLKHNMCQKTRTQSPPNGINTPVQLMVDPSLKSKLVPFSVVFNLNFNIDNSVTFSYF